MPSHREATSSSSRSRNKPDMMLPSTSKAHHGEYKKDPTQSPVSPIGRIAKRNAMKLNEMDVSGRSPVYSENFSGMIPTNLDVCDLNDKFPIISKILEAEEEGAISTEHLNALQKAIEELIAENVDNQKTIYGEITYLNTGEYPRIELNDRLMPSYSLRKRTSIENSKRLQTEESLLTDLGLNSSPEEEEGEDAPSILDVPQRFWNWTREYLRHITEEYLKEFKEKIVDRFSDAEIQKLLSKDHINSKSIGNGTTESHRKRNFSTPKLNGVSEVLQTPVLSKGRIKRRPAYLIEETMHMSPPKISKRESSTRISRAHADPPSSKMQSLVAKVIRCHQKSNSRPYHQSNGFEQEASEDGPDEDKKEFRSNGIHDEKPNGYHLSNGNSTCKSAEDQYSHGNGRHKDDFKSIGKALISLGVQKGILPKDTEDFSNDFDSDERSPNNTDFVKEEEDDEDAVSDEVSREIRIKQRELEELYRKTRPVILELYERIQAEYVLYETSRRLDLEDDKIFELGAKYERLNSLVCPFNTFRIARVSRKSINQIFRTENNGKNVRQRWNLKKKPPVSSIVYVVEISPTNNNQTRNNLTVSLTLQINTENMDADNPLINCDGS